MNTSKKQSHSRKVAAATVKKEKRVIKLMQVKQKKDFLLVFLIKKRYSLR